MFLLLQDFIRIAETYPASSPGSAGANGGNQSAVTAVADEGGSPAMTTAQLSQLSQSQEEAVIQELKSLCRRLPRTHLFSLGIDQSRDITLQSLMKAVSKCFGRAISHMKWLITTIPMCGFQANRFFYEITARVYMCYNSVSIVIWDFWQYTS